MVHHSAKWRAIPQRNGILLKRDGILLKRDGILLKQDGILLKRDEILLKWDEILLKRDEILPKRDGILLKRDEILLKRDGILLKRDEILLRGMGRSVKGRRKRISEGPEGFSEAFPSAVLWRARPVVARHLGGHGLAAGWNAVTMDRTSFHPKLRSSTSGPGIWNR